MSHLCDYHWDMATQQVSIDEVIEMLTEVADRHGLTLDAFRRAGETDSLDHWELREMWLMYGRHVLDASKPASA